MKKIKRLQLNNQGSAMIMALVVSVVLLVFCLSLLLASYSFMRSAAKKQNALQCREYAKSFCEELDAQITVSYPDYEAQNYAEEATNNGQKITYTKDETTVIAKPNNLWFFLRYNVLQDNWADYIDDEITQGHKKDDSWRYFQLKYEGEDRPQSAMQADVTMYWEKNTDADEEKDAPAILYVTVTASIGEDDGTKAGNLRDSSYSITSVYELQKRLYENPKEETEETEDTDVTEEAEPSHSIHATFNEADNSIVKNDQWTWILLERK